MCIFRGCTLKGKTARKPLLNCAYTHRVLQFYKVKILSTSNGDTSPFSLFKSDLPIRKNESAIKTVAHNHIG
jgi:hypothetical protein